MARPRKGTEEVWFDTFAEWPEEDRAAALKVLEHLHRALSREARRNGERILEALQIPERNAALDLDEGTKQ